MRKHELLKHSIPVGRVRQRFVKGSKASMPSIALKEATSGAVICPGTEISCRLY